MARVASTKSDEGNLLGVLTINLIKWLVDVCLNVETTKINITECINILQLIWRKSVAAQFEVARHVFAALGSVENVIYGDIGMKLLLENLYSSPVVCLKTNVRRKNSFL